MVRDPYIQLAGCVSTREKCSAQRSLQFGQRESSVGIVTGEKGRTIFGAAEPPFSRKNTQGRKL